jgi:signal transduction histidine kinase
MTELLDDLLTMGQAEAGKIKVINSEVDGPAFFNEIVTEIMHSTNNTHVIYPHINIPQGKITADIRLLRNIVINLLCNAVKYSPARKPIHFTVVRKDTNLIMEVKDSGIGIDGGDLDTIFNSFTRGKNVGTIQGTGLGLSIVQNAVEVLSGYVSVKSRLNEGSVFNVNIPLG